MSNKKNISVRLTDADLRSLKTLSGRLTVKESDLFRFVVKSSLNRVLPLLHGDLKGVDFLITLLDCGEEILRHFEFDAHQIDLIVNQGAPKAQQVAMEDIELVAIAVVNESYLANRLKEAGMEDIEGDVLGALKRFLRNKYPSRQPSAVVA